MTALLLIYILGALFTFVGLAIAMTSCLIEPSDDPFDVCSGVILAGVIAAFMAVLWPLTVIPTIGWLIRK